jgi:hypothetical protein
VHLAVLGDNRHLGALAVHVDADVNRHCPQLEAAQFQLQNDEANNASASQIAADHAAVNTALNQVVADQDQLALDQSTLAADQASSAADQASSAADQSHLVAEQSAVNSNQAAVSADQAAVSADQAAVSADQAAVSADQNAVASAQAQDDDTPSRVSVTFTVSVLGAAGQLAAMVSSGELATGPGTSLADKIAAARSYLAKGDTADACSTLTQFIKEVQAQSSKTIPVGRATQLISDATRIQKVLAR